MRSEPLAVSSAAKAWSRATGVPEPFDKQFLRALQLNFGQRLGSLVFLQRTFGLTDRGFEQTLFDAVERRPFLDQIAFLEGDLLQITR